MSDVLEHSHTRLAAVERVYDRPWPEGARAIAISVCRSLDPWLCLGAAGAGQDARHHRLECSARTPERPAGECGQGTLATRYRP